MPSFRHQGKRLSYDVHGEGERAMVLIHGLLMNRRMFERLGPEMARRGNRVICLDLLGHGRSDRPVDQTSYSMQLFGEQVVALLDHLELDEAVVGGTSLGANVSLEAAAFAPKRVRGMFIEMPVLDNALVAAAAIFAPMLVALRFGQPVMKVLSELTSRIPRSTHLVDIALDWVRQDPAPSQAVLEGLFFGRTAPSRSERERFDQPALIIGHPRDPLHPFTDADALAREMPNARLVDANSILEWRINPERLNDELAKFLDEVWRRRKRAAPRKRSGAKRSRAASRASGNSGKKRTAKASSNSGKKRTAKRSARTPKRS
jgi:pimeloyl-ACP methyl ester carboxylesterase